MPDWVYYGTDPDGTRRYCRETDDPDVMEVRMEQDISQVIERNKAEFNHNDGYSKSREFRRVARIPSIVHLKWLQEGFDYTDPNNAKEFMRRLNSSDYAHLRTAGGHLGYSNGRFR